MCGICGVFRNDSLEPGSDQWVQKMAAKLFHRGPDSYGYYGDIYCALSFRRLSIIYL